MLKLYQNEPYQTRHEFLQAKRLAEVLGRKYAFGGQASLCLNFSLGGKALDAALVTPNGFVIIELKAVGGDVECGESIENCSWKWRGRGDGGFHEISTNPYANPYSQVKNYRMAAINELEHRKTRFARKKVVDFEVKIRFAHWVKGCVVLSLRDATDVKVNNGEIPENIKKWFCHGSISSIPELLDGMAHGETMSLKEVQCLITEVIGLRKVDGVMERFETENRGAPRDEETSVPHEEPAVQSSRITDFYKKYSSAHVMARCKEEHKVAEEKTGILKNLSELDFPEVENVSTGNVKASSEKGVASHDKSLVTFSSESVLDPYVKVTLKQEMGYLARDYWDGRDPCELKGIDAEELVERICPDIGSFEVSVILCFGKEFSDECAGKIKEYMEQKYGKSKKWNFIEYNQGCVYFIFGQAKSQSESSIWGKTATTCKNGVNTRFVLPNWLNATIEKETEGLLPLSASEVQTTDQLSSEGVRRYVKTYLPRSCAEAFVVLDNYLGDATVNASISVLDVGCGSGGALLGCLLALHKHKGLTGCRVDMNMADVNDAAMDVAENLLQQGRSHSDGTVIEKARRYAQMKEALSRSYDVIVASKSIGEMALKGGIDAYEREMRACAKGIKPDGVLIVIDIPKHRYALERTTEKLHSEGFHGVVRESSIDIDNGSDQEPFVYTCLKHK